MVSTCKSWQEKLHNGLEAVVEKLAKPYAGMAIGDQMLIPTPQFVDDYI